MNFKWIHFRILPFLGSTKGASCLENLRRRTSWSNSQDLSVNKKWVRIPTRWMIFAWPMLRNVCVCVFLLLCLLVVFIMFDLFLADRYMVQSNVKQHHLIPRFCSFNSLCPNLLSNNISQHPRQVFQTSNQRHTPYMVFLDHVSSLTLVVSVSTWNQGESTVWVPGNHEGTIEVLKFSSDATSPTSL